MPGYPQPQATSMPAPQKPPINAAFFLTVWRQWWMVAVPVGIVLAATACTAVFLLFKPVYQSTATMKMNDEYVAFQEKKHSKTFFQNQVQLVLSPMVMQDVVTRSEVANIPEIREAKDPAEFLRKKLKIIESKGSDFFSISYDANDPKHAMLIVSAVSNAYERLQQDFANAKSKRIVRLLDEEKTHREKELKRLKNELRTMTKLNTGIDPFNPYGAEKQIVQNIDGKSVVRLRTSDPGDPAAVASATDR